MNSSVHCRSIRQRYAMPGIFDMSVDNRRSLARTFFGPLAIRNVVTDAHDRGDLSGSIPKGHKMDA